jgi:hypothetical protein
MKVLSTAQRHEIVYEYLRCRNITKVAQKLNVTRESVRKWVSRYKQGGQLVSAKRSGRKVLLDDDVAHKAMDMLLGGQFSGAQEVANELHKLGGTSGPLPVCRTTILRHAKALAASLGAPIKAVQTPPRKELSHETKANRLNFFRVNKGRNWQNVMFTDMCRFLFWHPRARVHRSRWLKKGQQYVAPKVNHAMSFNLYAGITPFGVTKPHLVAGTSKLEATFLNKKGEQAKSITTSEYEHVLLSTLLKEGKRLFGSHGVTSWVIKQDNDPSHKRASQKALKQWHESFKGCHVTLLSDWPPNSPDLSPIENVWAYVQRKVNKLGCQDFEDFKQNVLQALQNVPKGVIKKLYKSMKSRLPECVAKNGDRTHY